MRKFCQNALPTLRRGQPSHWTVAAAVIDSAGVTGGAGASGTVASMVTTSAADCAWTARGERTANNTRKRVPDRARLTRFVDHTPSGGGKTCATRLAPFSRRNRAPIVALTTHGEPGMPPVVIKTIAQTPTWVTGTASERQRQSVPGVR